MNDTNIQPDEIVIVSASIPTKLANIIGIRAKELDINFSDLAGQYILSGIEAERNKNDK